MLSTPPWAPESSVTLPNPYPIRLSLNGYFLTNPHTGSGEYTLHLLEHLQGTDVAVAKPPAPLGNLAKFLWEQRGWPEAAHRARADLLHCPYFALPLRRKLPAVVTIHDLIPMVLPAYRGSLLVRAYTWLQALACRGAQAILVDSDCSKRDVLRLLRVAPERVHVIYLGVDPRFSPDSSGDRPLEKPYVFYLGGWDVRKNVPTLIRAFSRIAPEYPDLVLAIAGQPGSASAMFPDLRALAAPLGNRVRFLGRVTDDEKLTLYRHAALFAFPSLYEGFGLDPLEALACGCPVVCSNAASLPEITGDAALLFDPRDESALISAMRRALRDPEPLRAKGPQQAAKFTWPATAKQTAEIYADVISLDSASSRPRTSGTPDTIGSSRG
jgi:glycosyltransferase involved in cell wall biosynthesis